MSSPEIIPWKITTLGELATIKGGKRLPKGEKFSSDKTSYPYIRVSDFSAGTIDSSDLRYVSDEIREKIKRYVISSENLYISIAGTLGLVGKIPQKLDGALLTENAAKIIFENNMESDKDFYRFYLNSQEPQSHFSQSKGTGGGVPKLALFRIEDTPVQIPPLPEQQKIAKILTSIDEVIEKTQAQIDKLKDLKTGMMQELLTNGIGHTKFKDSPVGRIPAEWEVKPLIEVVQKIIDCEHKTAPYVDKSEYLVVRTSNVRNGELIHQDMKFTTEDGFKQWTKRATPSVGDVLFTREAPAGESCLVPNNLKLCMGQRMVLLTSNQEIVNPDFFSMYLNSEVSSKEIYQLSIGTTVTRINIDDIKKIKCVVPPLLEQDKIADSVGSIQSSILKKQNKLKFLINLKKALMQDLLTGKVRVNAEPTA